MAELNKTKYPQNAERRQTSGKYPNFEAPHFSFTPNINDRTSVDDVIVTLSDSYENRRARQVVEWVRQQSVRRSV